MVYITSDHKGFDIKGKTIEFLKANKIQYEDLGPFKYDPEDDYPDYAFMIGEKVVKEKSKGIVFCGSGVGVCVAANKVKGVRASYIESEDHAIKSRTDDDANILVLDAMTFDPEIDYAIISTWLNTAFSQEERHIRRLRKIADYENNS